MQKSLNNFKFLPKKVEIRDIAMLPQAEAK